MSPTRSANFYTQDNPTDTVPDTDTSADAYVIANDDPRIAQTLKEDGKPKRPMNNYFIFMKMRRRELGQMHPDLITAEISKLLSKEWKSMPETEKMKYIKMSEKLKANFNHNFPDYVYSRAPNGTRKKKKGTKAPTRKPSKQSPQPEPDHRNTTNVEEFNFPPSYQNPVGHISNQIIPEEINLSPIGFGNAQPPTPDQERLLAMLNLPGPNDNTFMAPYYFGNHNGMQIQGPTAPLDEVSTVFNTYYNPFSNGPDYGS